jgi:hypothetical protein
MIEREGDVFTGIINGLALAIVLWCIIGVIATIVIAIL